MVQDVSTCRSLTRSSLPFRFSFATSLLYRCAYLHLFFLPLLRLASPYRRGMSCDVCPITSNSDLGRASRVSPAMGRSEKLGNAVESLRIAIGSAVRLFPNRREDVVRLSLPRVTCSSRENQPAMVGVELSRPSRSSPQHTTRPILSSPSQPPLAPS